MNNPYCEKSDHWSLCGVVILIVVAVVFAMVMDQYYQYERAKEDQTVEEQTDER